jgi:Tetratricopeptide repeat
MPEPIATLTASMIATLAFQEFVKSGAGELAKKFTAEAIAKMGDLRKLIWSKLKGNPDAEESLRKVEAGSEAEVSDVATYLKSVMGKDQEFAAQVQAIATDLRRGIAQTLTDVAKIVPRTVTLTDLAGLQGAIPHLQIVAEELTPLLDGLDALWSFNALGRVAQEQSRWQVAERWEKACLKMAEQRFGAEHPDTAGSLNNLALMYYKTGYMGSRSRCTKGRWPFMRSGWEPNILIPKQSA